MRADIGIALDGDADRVLIIDEMGKSVDGDQLMAVIAQSWKEDGRLAQPGIVATVMSNLGLERYLERHRPGPGAHRGRRPLRARTHAPSTATISAASNPATSSCRITARPATAWSRPCSCWPSSGARRSR